MSNNNNNNGDINNDIEIRPINSEEIEGMPSWIYDQVGWTTNDSTFLKVCQEFDPKGWLIARTPRDGIVGTVLSMNMNNSYSFAGLYLVSKAYRSRGIGKILWGKMLAHVGHRCLGINSVKPRVAANLKMGMSQPLFKVTIFNGNLNRGAKILDIENMKSTFKASLISQNSHGLIDDCTTKIDDQQEENFSVNKVVVVNDKKFNLNYENQLKKDDILIKDGIIKEGIFKTLNLKSADLQKYNLKYEFDNKIKWLYLMDGIDVDFDSLNRYDTQVHSGIPREKFLQTFLLLSTEKEYSDKIRCVVALTRTKTSLDNLICGYGIIRPRVKSHKLQNDCQYFCLGPLYADTPMIAQTLLIALINSIKARNINLEMTVPYKEEGENDQQIHLFGNPNFIYEAAKNDLGLNPEAECFRMYQNNILDKFADGTLYYPDSEKDIKRYNEEHTKISYPEIPLTKIYSFVSSDIYLD